MMQVYLLKLTAVGDGNAEVHALAFRVSACQAVLPSCRVSQVLLHRVLSGNSSSITTVMFSADSRRAQHQANVPVPAIWRSGTSGPCAEDVTPPKAICHVQFQRCPDPLLEHEG